MAKVLQSRETQAIRKTPGVVGGSACIRDTRISVSLLVGWQRLGLTDATILAEYPQLHQSDLDAAWHYASRHQDEIEAELQANSDDADD